MCFYFLRKKYRILSALTTLTGERCTLCHMSMMKVPVFLSNNCFRSLPCIFAGVSREVFFRRELIWRNEMRGISSGMIATKEWYVARRAKRRIWNTNTRCRRDISTSLYNSIYYFSALHNRIIFLGNLNRQGE